MRVPIWSESKEKDFEDASVRRIGADSARFPDSEAHRQIPQGSPRRDRLCTLSRGLRPWSQHHGARPLYPAYRRFPWRDPARFARLRCFISGSTQQIRPAPFQLQQVGLSGRDHLQLLLQQRLLDLRCRLDRKASARERELPLGRRPPAGDKHSCDARRHPHVALNRHCAGANNPKGRLRRSLNAGAGRPCPSRRRRGGFQPAP